MIALASVNTNLAQQNGGLFIGEINITGWDANGKQNLGSGSVFGWFNWIAENWNGNFDGHEWIDTLIVDPDMKPCWAVQW